MAVMVFVRENPVGSPIPAGCASPRARSIFEPVPGAVCDREKNQLKTTAPNAQDSIVSNPPQRSKKSEEHLRKDESSYCGRCVTFQDMRANCPDLLQ